MYEQIIAAYPELADKPETFWNGTIVLQDDGQGAYLKCWSYEKPIPSGIEIGKK